MTMSLHVLPQNEYRRATWKNGLGHTDEIAIHPEGADLRRGDFLFRLSSAHIAQASPFSSFPNHDRTLVIIAGKGVRLSHDYSGDGEEDTTEVPTLEPYDFPGDITSRCELISGPVTDLSLFIRKGEAEAITQVERISADGFEWFPEGRWNFLYSIDATLQIAADGNTYELTAGDTLAVEIHAPSDEGAAITLFSCADTSSVVFVSIQA